MPVSPPVTKTTWVFIESLLEKCLRTIPIRTCLFVRFGSGIHSAIDGKIRPRNVRGLRTGDERHHRGDLIHTPVTTERCGGLLRYRPITRGGIQFRVDRTRLDVVNRDATAPDFSGQRLSEHLDGSLRARV